MSSAPHAVRSAAASGAAKAGDVRLNVEQATFCYNAARREAPLFTLEATTFQARQRELVAILGPNASGKSTVLKMLAGTLRPLSGRVELDGVSISELAPLTRAQRIGVVHQESPMLFPIRAWEYVLQGRRPYGRMRWGLRGGLSFETEEDFAIVENAISQVGAAHLADRLMHQISGGEKQRIVVARALAQQPLVLLLDEPTLHLDIGAQVELLRHLRRLAVENRYTVVVVTHELNLAAEFADRVVLLHKGKCLRAGTPEEVYDHALLGNIFGADLDVEMSSTGRPRVVVKGQRQL